ncbi:MAG: hypothetical protein M3455_01800 [Actinomycetota bacterium]|nr:hypothetical protein [Actinomycetota bacterium]
MTAQLQEALPKRHYVDPAAYAEERDRVLIRSWSCAGRLDELGLAEAGSGRLVPQRAAAVGVLEESIVVAVTAAETLEARDNVCRHRGAQLIPHDPVDPPVCRAAKVWRCPLPLLDLRPGWPAGARPAYRRRRDRPGGVRTARRRSRRLGWLSVAASPLERSRPLPEEARVVVGLGAAHGFKFAPTFGRRLAELALGTSPGADPEPFRLDRPALTDPAHATSWLV